MIVKFEETAIAANFTQALKAKSFNWQADQTKPVLEILVSAFTRFLSANKSMKRDVGLSLEDMKGNPIFGAVVRYRGNEEDPEMPGSWNYSFSFDGEPLKDLEVLFKCGDTSLHQFINSEGMRQYHIEFIEPARTLTLAQLLFEELKACLDTNAKETDEFSIELEDHFIATVAIEGTKKVFSITPSELMKQLIKSDDAVSSKE